MTEAESKAEPDVFQITDPAEAERLIKKLEEDPIYFIEVFLGRQLSPKQQLFINSTKNHKHIVSVWSRQTGKSTVIASYILWRLLYGKGIVIHGEWMAEHIAIVAPIKDQIKNLYEKIKTLVDKSEFIASFIVKMNTEVIIAKNGNEAKFLSASPGSQIRGYTATCIVIDESQDITDAKYSGDVLPFGATTNALVIEAGTPKTKNHFWAAISSKQIMTIKQPWFECPFLSEEYVMGQKAISPDPLWRQEYLCEFVEEGVVAFPSKLFEPEMSKELKQLTGRWNLADYDYITHIHQFTKEKVQEVVEAVKEGATYTAGLDLGKQNDNTVYTVIRDDIRPMKVAVQIEFPLGTNYTLIAKQLSMFHRVFSPYEFNFDYSNEKMFIEALQDNDIGVLNDGKNVRGAIAFTNKNKAEMVSTARILLENYQIQLPKSAERLISQFLNQQYEINDQQNYKYFHPSNEHDDSLWSILLALKNMHIMTGDDVMSFQNPWEKFDEQTHGVYSGGTKDALSSVKQMRRPGADRYIPADMRRRNTIIR